MNSNYWIAIIVIIVIGAGAYLIWGMNSSPSSTSTVTTTSDTGSADAGSSDTSGANADASASGASASGAGSQTGGSGSGTSGSVTNASVVVIDYTDNGFSPSTVTVKDGQTVTFVNQSSGSMWVASNPHPVHTGYDGTSMGTHCEPGYSGAAPFDECAGTSGSWSFTFDKAGTWGYHNHLAPNMQGTIIVTANPGSTTE